MKKDKHAVQDIEFCLEELHKTFEAWNPVLRTL